MPPLDLTALTDEVARNESVDASASALLTTLFNAVEAAKNDPAAIQAIVDRVRSSNDALAAAVVANTSTPPV
ncbi:MAG: hypothetical protein ABJA98_01620 [Acidobacteriota bacterium]